MAIPDYITRLAKSEDFPVVKPLGGWEGFDVYLADTEDECAIGLPQYILFSPSALSAPRWATPDETEEIMKSFS